jgi:demethylmenaquinone methyltransferase/2-methoxy-6-polyprenyl-1,4-benzoquinol methylase
LEQVKPDKTKKESKKEQVEAMFDSIAYRYDFLNHFLSLGIDKSWRKSAIKMLSGRKIGNLLDVATGTGDFAIEASKIPGVKIIGIDISEKMLAIGREKVQKIGIANRIKLEHGDSEGLKFEANYFDAITAAFGVRNFENLQQGLEEMHRVLKPGGVVVIIEFSKPASFPFKQVYNLYFKYILPLIGRAISKDKSAYVYLPESVKNFPDGENFIKILSGAGFINCSIKPLTFGIASIYIGEK